MSPSLPILRLLHSAALTVLPQHRTPELKHAIDVCQREIESAQNRGGDVDADDDTVPKRYKAANGLDQGGLEESTSGVALRRRLGGTSGGMLGLAVPSGVTVRRNVSERVAPGLERKASTAGGGLSRALSLTSRLRAQRTALAATGLPATHITFGDRTAADVFWTVAVASARNGPAEVKRAVEAMRLPMESFPSLTGLTVFFEEPAKRSGAGSTRSQLVSQGSSVSTKALGGVHFHCAGAEILLLEEQSTLNPDRGVTWTVRRLHISVDELISDPAQSAISPSDPRNPSSPEDPLDAARNATVRALRTFDDVRTLRFACDAPGGLPWPEPLSTGLFDKLRKLSDLHLRGLRFPSAMHMESFVVAVVEAAPGLERIALWGSPPFERRGGWDGRKVVERIAAVAIPRRAVYKLRELRKLREVTLADHEALVDADWVSVLSAWPCLQALRLRRRTAITEEADAVKSDRVDEEHYTEAVLAASEVLPRLRVVQLSADSHPDPGSLESLVHRCRDLRDLALVCNPEHLGSEALDAILGHPKLSTFRYEVSQGEVVKPEIVVRMVQRFGPRHLDGAGGRWDGWEEV
ncbi:hypothetical protein HDU93_006153 [Gonapodya sp. JEL0774]|nr:hypothetical protein HDU93_006153 [Gonapodya sp. JEL0774]